MPFFPESGNNVLYEVVKIHLDHADPSMQDIDKLIQYIQVNISPSVLHFPNLKGKLLHDPSGPASAIRGQQYYWRKIELLLWCREQGFDFTHVLLPHRADISKKMFHTIALNNMWDTSNAHWLLHHLHTIHYRLHEKTILALHRFIDHIDSSGNTPLHNMVMHRPRRHNAYGWLSATLALLNHGADITLENPQGETPFQVLISEWVWHSTARMVEIIKTRLILIWHSATKLAFLLKQPSGIALLNPLLCKHCLA